MGHIWLARTIKNAKLLILAAPTRTTRCAACSPSREFCDSDCFRSEAACGIGPYAFGLTLGLESTGGVALMSASLQDSRPNGRGLAGLFSQRAPKKTPQLKHSIVADWLDTPGAVV
jgi:hypothetical protein